MFLLQHPKESILCHLLQTALPVGKTLSTITDDVLFIHSEHQQDFAMLSSAGIDLEMLRRV
jgi:hypothetical protein